MEVIDQFRAGLSNSAYEKEIARVFGSLTPKGKREFAKAASDIKGLPGSVASLIANYTGDDVSPMLDTALSMRAKTASIIGAHAAAEEYEALRGMASSKSIGPEELAALITKVDDESFIYKTFKSRFLDGYASVFGKLEDTTRSKTASLVQCGAAGDVDASVFASLPDSVVSWIKDSFEDDVAQAIVSDPGVVIPSLPVHFREAIATKMKS